MSKSGARLIEGMKEALAVAKGEQPAARISINGHNYVPEADFRQAVAEAVAEERAATARLAELWPVQGQTVEALEHAASEFRAFAASLRARR